MAISLTEEQRLAIGREGKVIVSASAGSGKTFVMIRKLISLILSGADMQDFLAVTFTNAAARSMREKLRDALIAAVNEAEDGEQKRALKKKLAALPMADISTIHSFCSRLIRNYFYEAGVSDSFEIISPEDATGKSLFDEAMENVVSEAYEAEDGDFDLLLRSFRAKRKKDGPIGNIQTVYKKVCSYVDFRDVLRGYGDFTEEKFDFFVSALKDDIDRRADGFLRDLQAMWDSHPFPPDDCEKVREAIENNLALVKSSGYFSLSRIVFGSFPGKGRAKQNKNKIPYTEEDFAFRDDVDKLKKEVQDFLKKLSALPSDREQELFYYLESGKLARALYAYTEKFADEYARLKRAKSRLDYNDLEQFALELLQKPAVREAAGKRYRYVFVDEYQDVNPMQEKILSLLGAQEVFLVGDKKQAIYSFRGGESRFFAEKEREFGDGRLALTSNFRSAPAILRFVNLVFSRAMTEESCGIPYAAAPMRGGERYGAHEGLVRLYEYKNEKETKEKPSRVYDVCEAALSAVDYSSPQAETVYSIICDCVNPTLSERDCGKYPPYVYYDIDEGIEKKVQYGDIAILVRSVTGDRVKNLINYLVEEGVPVTTLAEVNICDYPEIKRLILILEYLDNPEADIPLCGCLLSPLAGMTEDDLARIKVYADCHAEEGAFRSFRSDCALYAGTAEGETADKLNAFFAFAGSLRKRAAALTAREVLELVLEEGGMLTKLLARDNGESCLARVNRFLSECGKDDVHEFLRRLKILNFEIGFTESGGENAVKILTMHKSKGLEYPVVIVADLKKKFHDDKREQIGFDPAYGFAPRYYDLQNMVKRRTVFSLYAEAASKKKEAADELNLFYVALTRAKYALHLVINGELKDVREPNCQADFLWTGLREDYAAETAPRPAREKEEKLPLDAGGQLLDSLQAVYEKPYPFASSVNLAVKSSATTLLKEAGEEEEFYPAAHPFRAIPEDCPACGTVDMAVNADVGTAYHAFLEHADFAADGEAEYERMRYLLPKEQFELLSKTHCGKILAMPVFREMAGRTLYKEKKFIVSFPADKFDPAVGAKDEVLYQGAIDLLSVGKEGFDIVDYKYSRRSAADLKKHYAPQLRLYRAAVAKITGTDERQIRTRIVNILSAEEIPFDG